MCPVALGPPQTQAASHIDENHQQHSSSECAELDADAYPEDEEHPSKMFQESPLQFTQTSYIQYSFLLMTSFC